MTAVRTVQYCAHCGDLETMHEIRADGTRGKRLGSACRADGTTCCGVVCGGYQPGRTEERPAEDELRRRLAAVLVLTVPAPPSPSNLSEDDALMWQGGFAAALLVIGRAARGET